MTSLEEARALDAADPFAPFRDRFALPEGVIYLDGNSLGALPKQTARRQRDIIERQWGEDLIRSWNDNDWIGAPERIAGKIAPLIGAQPNEVIVADGVSVNIFKLLIAAARLRPDRSEILTETGNFPTDLYIAEGAAELIDGKTVRALPTGEVLGAIGPDTAIVLLTEVHYKTANRFDMAAVTKAAHDAGALMFWDVSHSTGAIPIDLTACGADMAVGCGYKYLNGGPTAPGFLFIREGLQAEMRSPLWGWMGHEAPFEFRDDYVPAPGIKGFLCSFPPMLSLLALESAIDLYGEVDMQQLAAKSAALFDLFAVRVEERCEGHGLKLVTPTDPARRGSHISFGHPDGWPIMQALIERGVIGDFRTPDILRFGLTPLYLSHEDIWRATEILGEILDGEIWRDPRYAEKKTVT